MFVPKRVKHTLQDAVLMPSCVFSGCTYDAAYFGRLSGKRGFLEVKELAVQAFILTPLPPGTDAHLQAGLN